MRLKSVEWNLSIEEKDLLNCKNTYIRLILIKIRSELTDLRSVVGSSFLILFMLNMAFEPSNPISIWYNKNITLKFIADESSYVRQIYAKLCGGNYYGS